MGKRQLPLDIRGRDRVEMIWVDMGRHPGWVGEATVRRHGVGECREVLTVRHGRGEELLSGSVARVKAVFNRNGLRLYHSAGVYYRTASLRLRSIFSAVDRMLYRHVCVESLGYSVPEEVITTAEIERRLEPLYSRLRLPEGRLELMSGIRERRFWRAGAMPSDESIVSGRRALDVAEIDPGEVGALIHASVCRDHLEPATACKVHHHLGLPADCFVYDVSNACLGLLNGVIQVANMIELGQIRAGLVVGTEGSRQLVETTIAALNRDTSLTRAQVKPAMASLTIGSASCAMLLVHRDLSRTGNRLLAARARAQTRFHDLCQSGQDEAGHGMQPLMETDAERLLQEGVTLGRETFAEFLREIGWSVADIHKSFCHQVGSAHRKQMLEAFSLPPAGDYTTFEWLGNTGAVALPITMAVGLERGHVAAGEQVAMLGIGSGINCLMLGVDWQATRVAGPGSKRPGMLPAGQENMASAVAR